MDHIKKGTDVITNRFGLHYFPDTLHYGEKDLKLWLPRLQQLQAGWLVLPSPTSRAIPEEFISAIAKAGIKPVVDFNYPLSQEVPWGDLEVLLRAYGRWGVTHALLNQQPNNQAKWSTNDWRRSDLVQSFTRQFQQFAQIALDCGIRPVYAPLLPGGDYWDLSFLEASLKQLAKEAPSMLLNNLTFSAYAWDEGKSLDWGAGGSKVWKGVKAYRVPRGSQDQRGFRTYEWYADVIQLTLGKRLPMLLFQAGLPHNPAQSSAKTASDQQELIFRLLSGENVYDPQNPKRLVKSLDSDLTACNFHLLASADACDAPYAWFSANGVAQAPAQAVLELQRKSIAATAEKKQKTPKQQSSQAYNFDHGRYVLIAASLKPRMQEILQKMHAYITRYKPMVGFSQADAKNSAYILVIAGQEDFSESDIEQLQGSGSLVRVIHPDELQPSFSGI